MWIEDAQVRLVGAAPFFDRSSRDQFEDVDKPVRDGVVAAPERVSVQSPVEQGPAAPAVVVELDPNAVPALVAHKQQVVRFVIREVLPICPPMVQRELWTGELRKDGGSQSRGIDKLPEAGHLLGQPQWRDRRVDLLQPSAVARRPRALKARIDERIAESRHDIIDVHAAWVARAVLTCQPRWTIRRGCVSQPWLLAAGPWARVVSNHRPLACKSASLWDFDARYRASWQKICGVAQSSGSAQKGWVRRRSGLGLGPRAAIVKSSSSRVPS